VKRDLQMCGKRHICEKRPMDIQKETQYSADFCECLQARYVKRKMCEKRPIYVKRDLYT